MLAGLLAGLALAVASQDAQAAQNPPVSDPTTQAPEARVDDVVVLGRQTVREQARAYVDTVARAPGDYRLAHWDRRICIGVAGLHSGYAQFLVDRISTVAASVDLRPGLPGCRPDVLIAFTREPDEVAQGWVARHFDDFRPSPLGQTDLGAAALERFKTSDAPVRWWHVSLSVYSDTGLSATRTTVNPEIPYHVFSSASLIQAPTREALKHVFIVVDANQIGDVSFGSLGDYLALLTLAQIDPEGDWTVADTVLNLFAGQPAARLSDWDADYLQSLYKQRSNPIRAWTQGRQIAKGLASRRNQEAGAIPVESVE